MESSSSLSMKEFVLVNFEDIVSLEMIYQAWVDFSTGKRDKKDVQQFEAHLEDELVALQQDLVSGHFVHNKYERFIMHEPKRRTIHKATVRDRVVHRLLYNALLPDFHKRWLSCSFSCRPGFGQHRSINAVQKSLRRATQNWSHECWTLKVDVKRFFDTVDHEILFTLLEQRISDHGMRAILHQVIDSFYTTHGRGLPIGNLTSQLFANVYLHEIDWHVKQIWKHKQYFRYADDMLFLCESKTEAFTLLNDVKIFLETNLRLTLHPDKITIRKSSWGIDWLGRVLLPGHDVLRPSTRRRMIRKVIAMQGSNHGDIRASLASYNGLLKGVARYSIDKELLQIYALDRISRYDII